MEKFKTHFDWLNKAFPEGLPIPSSTVITGPLGAGKPLMALAFVSSWLKEGGGVIAAPLQFPDPKFASENLHTLYGIKIQDYKERYVHVRFDPSIDSVKAINQNHMEANLVKPENWDRVISKAQQIIRESELGLMFFSSALNLPLFSATYSDSLMSKIQQMFNTDEPIVYVFCISTSMLREKAEEVGKMAYNLMEAEVLENPKRLRFRVRKMRNTEFLSNWLEAPFSQKILEEAEKRAKKFRVAPVNKIAKI